MGGADTNNTGRALKTKLAFKSFSVESKTDLTLLDIAKWLPAKGINTEIDNQHSAYKFNRTQSLIIYLKYPQYNPKITNNQKNNQFWREKTVNKSHPELTQKLEIIDDDFKAVTLTMIHKAKGTTLEATEKLKFSAER